MNADDGSVSGDPWAPSEKVDEQKALSLERDMGMGLPSAKLPVPSSRSLTPAGRCEPLSGVYASLAATGYEPCRGGVTEPGDSLIAAAAIDISRPSSSARPRPVTAPVPGIVDDGAVTVVVLAVFAAAEAEADADVDAIGAAEADAAAAAAAAMSFGAGDCGADEVRWAPFVDGRRDRFVNSSRCCGTICHFMPLPGSSVRRGIFSNALFSDRLCLMEFLKAGRRC